MGNNGSLTCRKAVGAWRWSLPSAVVMNAWNYTSTPPIPIQDVAL